MSSISDNAFGNWTHIITSGYFNCYKKNLIDIASNYKCYITIHRLIQDGENPTNIPESSTYGFTVYIVPLTDVNQPKETWYIEEARVDDNIVVRNDTKEFPVFHQPDPYYYLHLSANCGSYFYHFETDLINDAGLHTVTFVSRNTGFTPGACDFRFSFVTTKSSLVPNAPVLTLPTDLTTSQLRLRLKATENNTVSFRLVVKHYALNKTEAHTLIDRTILRDTSSTSGTTYVLDTHLWNAGETLELQLSAIGPTGTESKYIKHKLVRPGAALIKVDDVWKYAIPYVKINGVWQTALSYIKIPLTNSWVLTSGKVAESHLPYDENRAYYYSDTCTFNGKIYFCIAETDLDRNKIGSPLETPIYWVEQNEGV